MHLYLPQLGFTIQKWLREIPIEPFFASHVKQMFTVTDGAWPKNNQRNPPLKSS